MSVFNYNLSYVHKNPDVFEIAYFFNTNRPSVHTKPRRKETSTTKVKRVRPGSDAELFMSRTYFELRPTEIIKTAGLN